MVNTEPPSAQAGESRHADTTDVKEKRVEIRRRSNATVFVSINGSDIQEARLIDVSDSGAKIALQAELTNHLTHGIGLVIAPTAGIASSADVRPGEIAWLREDSNDMTQIGIRLLGSGLVSLEPLDIDRVKIDTSLALRMPVQRAARWQILPFTCDDDRVLIAASDVPSPRSISAIQRLYGLAPEVHLTQSDRLALAIDRIYAGANTGPAGGGPDRATSIDRGSSIDLESGVADDADAVSLCDRILTTAAVQNASDIHIDSYEAEVRIRFRIDGQIEEGRTLTPEQGAALISRFKVLAGLDISERRAPQDGRMRHEHGGTPIDIRVASLPAKQGERLTLRLLARDTGTLTLPKLGMSPQLFQHFNEAIRKPHGMVLITGPTGSGKSTTLYAAIRQLITESRLNVVTIEDPVEYQIDGITQVEVDQREKVTFAKALRSTLRHDPDVIMVGEIRDAETADIAIKAALTGHLVFSTLHTNDAAGAITRLRDMGVPLYLISATLRLVMAQRLVRRLCDRCSKIVPCPAGEAQAIGRADLEGRSVYEPAGCMYCGGKGYSGRLALFEALPNDTTLAQMIAAGSDETDYKAHMLDQGLPGLADDAAEKLLTGQTSVAEVLRNVMSVSQ